jgi:tRNA-binding protein
LTGAEAWSVLELRIGRVARVEPHTEARKPAYKLWIDFGPLGGKTSSAQLAALYRPEDLVGRLVVAAVNLGTRRIAGFPSEVLVLGVPDAEGNVVLLGLEREAPAGAKVF